MMEMNQTAFLLRHATRKSIVLVDELGRGTSTFDGLANGYAVLKHLIWELRCRALFSTHYHKLIDDFSCDESQEEGRAVITHMACDMKGGTSDIHPTFKLRSGPSPLGSCGLLIARKCGLPRPIVDRADVKSSETGANVSMNAGRLRKAAVPGPHVVNLDEDEFGWICDMTDDLVLSHCAEPDDAFFDDFLEFWMHIRVKKLRRLE